MREAGDDSGVDNDDHRNHVIFLTNYTEQICLGMSSHASRHERLRCRCAPLASVPRATLSRIPGRGPPSEIWFKRGRAKGGSGREEREATSEGEPAGTSPGTERCPSFSFFRQKKKVRADGAFTGTLHCAGGRSFHSPFTQCAKFVNNKRKLLECVRVRPATQALRHHIRTHAVRNMRLHAFIPARCPRRPYSPSQLCGLRRGRRAP